MRSRSVDIGHTFWGEFVCEPPEGTTIAIDPVVTPENLAEAPGLHQIMAEVEHLPFRTGSLDRVTSESALGEYTLLRESLEEVVRSLRSGGKARIRVCIA